MHLDRTWIRNYPYLVQHPLLSFRRTERLPGHEDLDQPSLCHYGALDAVLDLLLDFNSCPLRCSFLVQPASVRVCGLYDRLSVS